MVHGGLDFWLSYFGVLLILMTLTLKPDCINLSGSWPAWQLASPAQLTACVLLQGYNCGWTPASIDYVICEDTLLEAILLADLLILPTVQIQSLASFCGRFAPTIFCILHPVFKLRICCVSCSHLLLHQWRPDPLGGVVAGDHSQQHVCSCHLCHSKSLGSASDLAVLSYSQFLQLTAACHASISMHLHCVIIVCKLVMLVWLMMI